MWQALIAPITGLIGKWQDGRAKKQEAQAEVDRILTEASASSAEIAGKIALVRTQNEGKTWKDEYALIVITAPVVVGMATGVAEAFAVVPVGTTTTLMEAMFVPINQLPDFWQNTFQVGILSALGVNLWNKSQKV